MKQKHAPLSTNAQETKSIQRKLALQRQQLQSKTKNPKLVRIVQSVTAGHIRGGHSFH